MASTVKKGGMKKGGIFASVLGVMIIPSASTSAGSRPHISPPKASVHVVNIGSLTFDYSYAGLLLSATCTIADASGTTPPSGLTVKLAGPLRVSGCSDDTGNTDDFKTKGEWSLTLNGTGSQITLNVPKGGATFTSKFYNSCHLYLVPSASKKLHGSYDNVSTVRIGAAPIPVATHGSCKATRSATITAMLVFEPGISVVQ